MSAVTSYLRSALRRVWLVLALFVAATSVEPAQTQSSRSLNPRPAVSRQSQAAAANVKNPAAATRAKQFAQLTGGLKLSQVKAENVCGPARPGMMSCVSQKLVLRKSGKPVHPPAPAGRTFTQVFPADSQGISPASGGSTATSPPAPGTPAWLQQAYDLSYLSQTGGVGATVAIVDAYDDPTAESDLATYRSNYGLPACSTANGCFTKVNGMGNSTPLPTPNGQWEGEIGLDLDAVSALCPNCHILLVEVSAPGWNTLSQGVQTAAAWPGVKVVSNSYGADLTTPISYSWTHAGVPTVYGTGDWGSPTASQGVFYPAALPGATAAGGTNLISSWSQTGNYNNPTQLTPTARGFQESAWAYNGSTGGGSGCNTQTGIVKPSYQTDTGCAGRSYADVSADADPTTGINVYSSIDGGWVIYGGTSLATPLVSAYMAATGANNASDSPSWAYGDASSHLLYDPTGGSTASGACASAAYICTAGAGYDGPTGAGSISGTVVQGAPGIGGAPIGWGGWNSTNTYATSIGASSATVTGGVYPNGLDTSYYWQYGTTNAYGQQTNATASARARRSS